MSRCCRCGCDKINFKQFDFSDGTLIWQRLLYSPTLDVNGNVFAVTNAAEFTGAAGSAPFSLGDITVTMPTRSFAGTQLDYYVREVNKHAAADGTISSTSPPLYVTTTTLESFVHNELAGPTVLTADGSVLRGMTPSAWQVNSNGDRVVWQGNRSSGAGWVENPTSTDTELTYWLDFRGADSANIVLTDSDANVATVSITDNAAAIKAEIEAELSCSSATVTGTSFQKALMKVVIDWNDNTKYLDTAVLDYTGSQVLLGNMYLQNLVTGDVGNGGTTGGNSTSYNGSYAWQSDGNLFRRSANPSSATTRRYESWDTSTSPWTLDWNDEPLGSRTPIGDGFTMQEIELVADGGIVGIAIPYTAANFDPLIERTSVISWNNDGTGEIEYDGEFTGWVPLGLAIEDGSDKMAANFVTWKDETVDTVHGTGASDDDYCGLNGEDYVRWVTGSRSTTYTRTCRGDFEQRKAAGFNSTHAAICNTIASSSSGEDNSALAGVVFDDHVGYSVTSESSGIIHSTNLTDIPRWRLSYEMFSEGNGLLDTTSNWRIVFDDGATTEETGWFSFSDSLATVNAELTTIWGSSTNGDVNVVATAEADVTPSCPLYKRTLHIECLGARNADEEGEMGTPDIFTLGTGTANFVRGQMPEIRVEIQDFERDVPGTIGARNWSTGVVTWDRNFNTSSNPKQIQAGVLKGGKLYVLARAAQCSETIPGGGVEDPEEETPP